MAKIVSPNETLKTTGAKKATRHFWRYILWPVSVWLSFRQFAEHEADDYVELTSPIMAAAIALWILVAWLVTVMVTGGLLADFYALVFMIPFVYGAGLWLYMGRESRFRE